MSTPAHESSPIEKFLQKNIWKMLLLTPVLGASAAAVLFAAHVEASYHTRVALTYMFGMVVPILMMGCMLYMLVEGKRNKPYLHIAATACALFVLEIALKYSGLIIISMIFE